MFQLCRKVPWTRRDAYSPPEPMSSVSIGLRLGPDEAVGKAIVSSGFSAGEGQTVQIQKIAPKVSRAMSRS